MSREALLMLYMLILFSANVLGAIGGFGAGLISIPFLTQLFDAKTVIMASTITCMLNVWLVWENRKNIDFRQLKIIGGYMCLGLPVGVAGLKYMSVPELKLFLGLFMILLGIYGLVKLRIPAIEKYRFSSPVLRVILFLAGVIQGAISSGGSLVLLYTQQEIREKDSFRATLALLWTLVSILTVTQYQISGTLCGEAWRLALTGFPAVLLGIYIGNKISRQLSRQVFLYVIHLLILSAGILNCISCL